MCAGECVAIHTMWIQLNYGQGQRQFQNDRLRCAALMWMRLLLLHSQTGRSDAPVCGVTNRVCDAVLDAHTTMIWTRQAAWSCCCCCSFQKSGCNRLRILRKGLSWMAGQIALAKRCVCRVADGETSGIVALSAASSPVRGEQSSDNDWLQ